MKKIILASTSIYRKQQLERLVSEFETMSPNVDEAPLKASASDHETLSRQLSELKANAIAVDNPDAIVIGGDQVASFNHTILSKPVTKENAFRQLQSLSGQTHQLITSLAIFYKGQSFVHTCKALMQMRKLSDDQIRRYIDKDDPLKCCGAYRIESLGIGLFERIHCDDHTSIVGIPLLWTAKQLSQLGVDIP